MQGSAPSWLMTMKLFLAIVLFCGTVSRTTADFRSVCYDFAKGFMDPIVNPGQRSSHEHHFGGSLGFSPFGIDEAAMRADVSSCDVEADFSNYWVPTITFLDPELGGARTPLETILQAYWVADPNEVSVADPTVLGVPLQMIAGDANGQPRKQIWEEDTIRFVCIRNTWL
ncbi:unnamed protein product, partial [Phaeothamnion confervicola]